MPNDDPNDVKPTNGDISSNDPTGDDQVSNDTQEATPVSTTTSVISDTSLNPDSTSTSPTSYAPAPNTVITAPQAPKKYGGKKAIVTMFALGLLLIGAISTIFLVQRQSLVQTSAWDCSKYTFSVSRDGVVQIQNGSNQIEPAQKADVYINNTKVGTFDVPVLNAGQAATLGTVTVPNAQGFTWRVDGLSDCENSGKYDASTSAAATCGEVKAYDTNWKLLSADDLKKLKSGTVVRFAVAGTASSGTFDKARFTVNGSLRPEVTTKKPSSDEFYDEYTIPTGTTTFTVSAEIHHGSLGWF